MTDFGDLYMEVILDHNKNPRNKGEIEDHTNLSLIHISEPKRQAEM